MNAKFSSSLKLLAIRQNEEEKPMFDLLDGQNITLTLEFISTGFQCDAVKLQRNLGRDQMLQMNYRDCLYENATDTLIVSSLLPQHLITVQFSLTGPFFVGGLRVCLSGPGNSDCEWKIHGTSIELLPFRLHAGSSAVDRLHGSDRNDQGHQSNRL